MYVACWAGQGKVMIAAGSAGSAGEEAAAEEVVLRLTVPNVSRLEDVAFSNAVSMRGHMWRIMVVHREVSAPAQGADGRKDVMGAYIQHVGPKILPQQTSVWSIVVNASITLVNQLDAEKSYSKEFRHQYTRNSVDWGYSTFLRWKEVINPLKGFMKDDTIVLQARLVYPDPDVHADPAPSQSHITPPSSTSSQSSAQPTSLSHIHSQTLSRYSNSNPPQLMAVIPRTLPHSCVPSLPAAMSTSQAFSLSQSSQESESSQLTPASTSVLPPEMAVFLSCPRCSEHYEDEGQKTPNTLKCGHTFCLECLRKLMAAGEGEKQALTCCVCGQEHSVASGDALPWFPNHSMVQLISSVLSKAKHFCPIHQHDRNYYCFEDKSLVCIYCAYHGEHASHQCRPVGEAKLVVREGLRAMRMQTRSRVTEIERRLRLMKDEQEGVRTQAQASSRLVEEFFGNIEAVIRRQRDLLLQDLTSHTNELNSSLDTHIRELEKQHSMTRGSLEDYDRWKILPAREALVRAQSITQSLQTTANSHPHDPRQAFLPQLRVSVELPSSSVLTSLGPLGRVTVSQPAPLLPPPPLHLPPPPLPPPLPGPTDRPPVVQVDQAAPQKMSVTVNGGGEEREMEAMKEEMEVKGEEGDVGGLHVEVEAAANGGTQEGETPVGGALITGKHSDSSSSSSSSPAAKKRKL